MIATANLNGVNLAYEVCGQGAPLILLHEYATDMRAWESQVRFFSRFYKVIRFNNRGYPPSTVPVNPEDYLHDRFIDDIGALIDYLELDQVFLVGIATGGNLALNYTLRHPEKVRGLVVIGAGAGTSDRENWLCGARDLADAIKARGVGAVVDSISAAPQRLALKRKDPLAWREFQRLMSELDPVGAEFLMRVTLTDRLPVSDLTDAMRQCKVPMLVMLGDQDTPADEACRMIAQMAPNAGLMVLPNCGHTLNLEEPFLFNQAVSNFLASVTAGRWGSWHENKDM